MVDNRRVNDSSNCRASTEATVLHGIRAAGVLSVRSSASHDHPDTPRRAVHLDMDTAAPGAPYRCRWRMRGGRFCTTHAFERFRAERCELERPDSSDAVEAVS